jgi:protein-S-isoprenylcysteine O-methyltransferase Ste14
MKRRIKFDSAMLSFLIILTGFLYLNKSFFLITSFFDNILDFFGFLVILKGTLLRMAARGHKKAYSILGGQLVTTGPYAVVRNPMYLGSFLMGAGFVLMLWPWWSLPLFALLFYLRFNRQIIKEESHLSGLFGGEFAAYCQRTPRLFPSAPYLLPAGRPGIKRVKVREIFNLKEAFSTKERRGLPTWPALAVGLEAFQEYVVFGRTDIRRTLCLFLAAALVFTVSFWLLNRYD